MSSVKCWWRLSADVSIKENRGKVVKAKISPAKMEQTIREMIKTHEALRIKIGENCAAKLFSVRGVCRVEAGA